MWQSSIADQEAKRIDAVSYTHLDVYKRQATLKTKYPQGAERSLIYATTGRSINSSMLPADAGCIVDNVATIVAIKEAVKDLSLIHI